MTLVAGAIQAAAPHGPPSARISGHTRTTTTAGGFPRCERFVRRGTLCCMSSFSPSDPIDPAAADRDLVVAIRRGDEAAWQTCIDRFEGRLMAFVTNRVGDRSLAEDLVQETFLGFMTSLPNYDDATPLESFLFSIAAHKVIDSLRRKGRRPPLRSLAGASAEDSSGPDYDPMDRGRRVSSAAASRERQSRDEHALRGILAELIAQWTAKRDYVRLQCLELLLVLGWPNKRVAEELGITEQDVANHKSYVLYQIRQRLERLGLTPPRDVVE